MLPTIPVYRVLAAIMCLHEFASDGQEQLMGIPVSMVLLKVTT